MPAPHEITSDALAAARARFDRFRLEIWQSTSAQRGHRFRTKAMALVPVGTRRFAIVSRTGALVLRVARKVGFERQHQTSMTPPEFPKGFNQENDLSSDENSPMVLFVGAPNDPASWENVNAALGGHDSVIVCLVGTALRPGAAQALRDKLHASGAAMVTGDDVVTMAEQRPLGRFRPNRLGLVSLLSYDAVGGVACFASEALAAIGGFSTTRGTLGLHDAAYRLVKAGKSTAHVSRIVATSDARTAEERTFHAAWTVEQLAALGFDAPAQATKYGSVSWQVELKQWPSVTIVIPTRDRLDLLERCLRGVEQSSYPNFNVVICNNDSVEPATLAYLAGTPHTVVAAPGPFNYSSIVNKGVARSNAEFIVTLNNDVEIHDADWLERLVGPALLPGVGLVGCALREPSGEFQHEAIAIAPYPQHLRRDLNYWRIDEFLTATREVAAVTGACTLIDRALWQELGGLDPTLAVIGNDVDLCLRAAVAGAATVYVADLELTHAESSSRGSLNPPQDIYRLVARWGLFDDYVDPWFPSALRIIADEVVSGPQ